MGFQPMNATATSAIVIPTMMSRMATSHQGVWLGAEGGPAVRRLARDAADMGECYAALMPRWLRQGFE